MFRLFTNKRIRTWSSRFSLSATPLEAFSPCPSLFQVWSQDGARLIKMHSLAKIRLHCQLILTDAGGNAFSLHIRVLVITKAKMLELSANFPNVSRLSLITFKILTHFFWLAVTFFKVCFLIWQRFARRFTDTPRQKSPCFDRHEKCPEWSDVGYCDVYSNYMFKKCPLSCEACYPGTYIRNLVVSTKLKM